MTKKSKIDKTILVFKDIVKKYKINLPEEGIPRKPVRKLLRFFQTIEDARVSGKVAYPLHEIIMVAFLAIIAGAGSFIDIEKFGKINSDWLKTNFYIESGIPSHDTFRRIFSIVHPEQLQAATVAFLIDNIKMIKRALKLKRKE
jgi:hypothetical protein